MQTRSVILVVAAGLLVPFVYGASSIPDVCAEPKDPNWGKTGECLESTDGKKMVCCWKEADGDWWCQVCDTAGGGTNCGPVELRQPTGPMGTPGGGVLQDPSTDSAPKVPGKGGFSLGPNLKFSQSNTTSSNDSSTTRTGIETSREGQELSYEDSEEEANKTGNKTITEEDEEK